MYVPGKGKGRSGKEGEELTNVRVNVREVIEGDVH